VYDLGRDVPLDQFVDEQLKTDSDLVCLSAMMTTSMIGMPKVIEKIKAKNPNCMIMIGGAPTSKELADKWGADGYAEDASNALKEAIKMVSFLRKLREEKAAQKK
jgi:methanogenic corrinoid protein MtbC1